MRPLMVQSVTPQESARPRSWAGFGPVRWAALLLGLGLLLMRHPAAGTALVMLFLAMTGYKRLALAYNRPGTPLPPADDPTPGPGLRSALLGLASALVTLQGVMLTLVFTFVGPDHASLAVKISAASLAIGVVLGMGLMLSIALGVSTKERRQIAFDLLLWVSYACTLGILSLACAVIIER